MDDFTPFMQAATFQHYAAQVLETLSADGDQAFLLWKAYLKRMKPMSHTAALDLTNHMAATLRTLNIKIEPEHAILVADLVGEALWRRLDEAEQREWLLKAV